MQIQNPIIVYSTKENNPMKSTITTAKETIAGIMLEPKDLKKQQCRHEISSSTKVSYSYPSLFSFL